MREYSCIGTGFRRVSTLLTQACCKNTCIYTVMHTWKISKKDVKPIQSINNIIKLLILQSLCCDLDTNHSSDATMLSCKSWWGLVQCMFSLVFCSSHCMSQLHGDYKYIMSQVEKESGLTYGQEKDIICELWSTKRQACQKLRELNLLLQDLEIGTDIPQGFKVR